MVAIQIKSVLKELGLSDTEQTIYLALMQVGTAPASVLGQRTEIAKSTAQYTCQQLLKKGLISRIEKNKTYLYRGEDPQRLLFLLEHKRAAINKQEEHVQQIIGPLKEWMQPELTVPRIRTYEGVEQLKVSLQTMLDSLSEGDEILSYVHGLAPADPLLKKMYEVLVWFGEQRVKRKIFRKMLVADNPQAKEFIKDTKKYHWEIRTAPKGMFDCSPSEIIIYKDTVWSLAVEQGFFFAYSVEHHSFATLQRDAFELAWKQVAKRR